MARLARWQLGMLHSVPQSLGIQDEHRRLLQRNLAGCESAADMDYAGFVACMAFYEDAHGWVDGQNGPGCWGRQIKQTARRGGTGPLRGKAIKLACLIGWTDTGEPDGRPDYKRLDGMVARQSHGKRTRLLDATREDLMEIVEALKDMARREGVELDS